MLPSVPAVRRARSRLSLWGAAADKPPHGGEVLQLVPWRCCFAGQRELLWQRVYSAPLCHASGGCLVAAGLLAVPFPLSWRCLVGLLLVCVCVGGWVGGVSHLGVQT